MAEDYANWECGDMARGVGVRKCGSYGELVLSPFAVLFTQENISSRSRRSSQQRLPALSAKRGHQTVSQILLPVPAAPITTPDKRRRHAADMFDASDVDDTPPKSRDVVAPELSLMANS